MKTMISAIFAVSALLIGASSFADRGAPQAPPPQQDDCQQDDCGPVQQAPPPGGYVDNDYYGPGQAGLYGSYDITCLPDFDEDLYYRCDYDDFSMCAPIVDPRYEYGVVYPYPRPGVVITPVFARQYWAYYGQRGLVNIYRGGYRGQYVPRVIRPFSPNMMAGGRLDPRFMDPRLRGAVVNPGVVRGGFVGGPGLVRPPVGAVVGMPMRGAPPGVIVNQQPRVVPNMVVPMQGGRPMVGGPGVGGPGPRFFRR